MGIKRQIESRHRFLIYIYMTCQRKYKNGTVRLTSLLIKWSTTFWTSSPGVFDIECLNWYNAQSKFIKKYRMDRRGYKSCHSISHVYWDTLYMGGRNPRITAKISLISKIIYEGIIFCHKLTFSHHYIFETWWREPLISQT